MSNASTAPATLLPSAGPFRRFAALVYDSLLLLAVLFLGTLVVLPLSGGEAITLDGSGPWEYVYRIYVLLLILGFFGLPWTRRGQTLGMMSWKIRLVLADGGSVSWQRAALRLAIGVVIVAAALSGLWLARGDGGALPAAALSGPALVNYLWMAFDGQSRTLQDVLSATRVVRLPG